MPTNPLEAFKADPTRVRITWDTAQAGADLTTWCIELDSNATVPEFVLLVVAFRCRAEVITGEMTRLVPVDPSDPVPTAEQVAQVFERGLEGYRSRVARAELEVVG